jgi:hypothetical protein
MTNVFGRRRRARMSALAAGVLVAAAATAAVQLATGTPAAAVTGMEVVWANSNVVTAAPQVATATVYCPTGKRVIGGGGGVAWDLTSTPYDVVLTRMQPVHPWSGPDNYVVTGERIPSGTSTNWWVRAYAICVDPLPGLRIVWSFSATSSASSQRAEAPCADDEQVVGTGAYIYGSAGQVGLQVMRASIRGDLVYAQGHEDADGFAGSWYVMSVAVCADPIDGYEVIQVPSPEDDSESSKSATAQCSTGKTLYGGGGATAFDAPGAVSLRWISVDTVGDDLLANAIENTSTSTDWDFIVAQAICGY